jgi:type IV secretory pathway component VirB8
MSNKHDSASQIERRKANLAQRERKDRIWTIVIIVIGVALFVTIIAIQISHHL